jgi:hypothetical protein
MSKKGGTAGQQEQRGDRATECPVCFETYEAPPSQQAPVSLPCGHTFCREHAASDTGQADQVDGGALQICCPTCRQHSPMPEDGAAGLPVNYALVAVVQEQQAQGGGGGSGGGSGGALAPLAQMQQMQMQQPQNMQQQQLLQQQNMQLQPQQQQQPQNMEQHIQLLQQQNMQLQLLMMLGGGAQLPATAKETRAVYKRKHADELITFNGEQMQRKTMYGLVHRRKVQAAKTAAAEAERAEAHAAVEAEEAELVRAEKHAEQQAFLRRPRRSAASRVPRRWRRTARPRGVG